MPALYVVRHAEPAVTGVLLGQSDPPLSEFGRKQAANLGVPASGPVYSSPLRRALETAHFLGPDPIVLPELAEISYGLWDGRPWAEIERKWPQLASQKLSAWQTATPPGGESWSCFYDRVLRALTPVLKGPLPAIIVAHEAVNAIISNCIAKNPITGYQQQYCEIRKYEI
jgi:broad specificity phosphatase PhoE